MTALPVTLAAFAATALSDLGDLAGPTAALVACVVAAVVPAVDWVAIRRRPREKEKAAGG